MESVGRRRSQGHLAKEPFKRPTGKGNTALPEDEPCSNTRTNTKCTESCCFEAKHPKHHFDSNWLGPWGRSRERCFGDLARGLPVGCVWTL